MPSVGKAIVIPLTDGDNLAFPFEVQCRGSWRNADEIASLLAMIVIPDEDTVVRLYEKFHPDAQDYGVSIQIWDPYTCQGSSFTIMDLVLLPSPDCSWSRLSANVAEDFWTQNQQPAMEEKLKAVLEFVMQAVPLDHLEISGLEHEIASDILYQKLLNNPKATKLEFSYYKGHQRNVVDLCCKLVANSTTLKEVVFYNIGKFEQDSAQRLFQAMQSNNSNLKILNLRRSRYLESWGKRGPGNKGNKPIRIEPLVSALLGHSERHCPLEVLDLGGNPILSTSPRCPLAAARPSLGLKRLSLRGCSLTETALLDIAKGLEENHVLRHLDLSHNTLTKPIIEQLALSLEKNTMLKTLKLEHCKIDLDLVQYLAKSLPNIRNLQSLHMDGNEFTWKPLLEDGESVGANLLLEALERNRSLVSVEMGEFGMLSQYGMACCTSPPYSTTLNKDNTEKFRDLLERNATFFEKNRSLRAQQAVVRIAEVLLTKMEESDVESVSKSNGW
jgi:hypothetical protein